MKLSHDSGKDYHVNVIVLHYNVTIPSPAFLFIPRLAARGTFTEHKNQKASVKFVNKAAKCVSSIIKVTLLKVFNVKLSP